MNKIVKIIDTLEVRLATTSTRFRFNISAVPEPATLQLSTPEAEKAKPLDNTTTNSASFSTVANSTSGPDTNENATLENPPTFFDADIFSLRDSCLYLYLLGNCYRKLAEKEKIKPPSQGISNTLKQNQYKGRSEQFVSRCTRAYRQACEVAAKSLPISDALRLACLYSLCKALCDLSDEYEEARVVAMATFDYGTKHSHTLSDTSVALLQRIRDEFLASNVGRAANDNDDVDDEDEEQDDITVNENKNGEGSADSNIRKTLKPAYKKKVSESKSKKRLKTALVECVEQQYAADLALLQPVEIEVPSAPNAIAAPATMSKEMQEFVLGVKRAMFLPSPVPLEACSSGAEIYKAMDTIFRVYIRGNALAGLQSTGTEVAISNRHLALNKFLLEGPFMSWRGFVSVLVDFRIVSRYDPLVQNKSAEESGPGKLNAEIEEEDAESAPLKALHAACIFIEASGKSHFKSLSIDSFQKFKIEDSKSDLLQPDSWTLVYEWLCAPKQDPQKITAGVSFGQFVDALGKCGMVAYSSGRVAEMLTSPEDKIDHFLTANMGLHSRDRWKNILKNRMKKSKAALLGATRPRPTAALSSSASSSPVNSQPDAVNSNGETSTAAVAGASFRAASPVSPTNRKDRK